MPREFVTTKDLRIFIGWPGQQPIYWPVAVIERITWRPDLPTRIIATEILSYSSHLADHREVDIFVRRGVIRDPSDYRNGIEVLVARACKVIKVWMPHTIGYPEDVNVSIRALLETNDCWLNLRMEMGMFGT